MTRSFSPVWPMAKLSRWQRNNDKGEASLYMRELLHVRTEERVALVTRNVTV